MAKQRFFRQDVVFSDETQLLNCMKHFSSKEDHSLNFDDFKHLIADLVSDSYGKPYDMSESLLSDLFTTFDCNNDSVIDVTEFTSFWNDFIKPLKKPVTAILIIDVQNDFIDGSLALKRCPARQDGRIVISVINSILDKFQFDCTVYTLDCHPEDHMSFIENVHLYELSNKNKDISEISVFDTVLFEGEISQKLWPSHCVKNTWGCKLHDDLKVTSDCLLIYKGTSSTVDSYSAFSDNKKDAQTALHEKLKEKNITHVFIVGLAFDYCVYFTALDALELGYVTIVIRDATRGTDDNNIKKTAKKLNSKNCILAYSSEIKNMLNGKDIKAQSVSVFLQKFKKW